MNFILFDHSSPEKFYPLTLTRPISEIRIGILRIREKWEHYLEGSASWITADHLKNKYPVQKSDQNILINSRLYPDKSFVSAIRSLKPGQIMRQGDDFLAANILEEKLDAFIQNTSMEDLESTGYNNTIDQLNEIWEIFSKNHKAIENDYALLTQGRKSAILNDSNRIKAAENIFVEEGAQVDLAILNAEEGPIYIGKEAKLMEEAIIHGPVAIGDHATVKFGAKIYDGTTIGPYCKAAGEILNTVMTGYTNKSHEGFLGNSVLGEWCNIGADSNNSNLKNNYSNVKIWNYGTESFTDTGLLFFGMIMGDHSKCGINTMFNTGTMVGVSANIYGAGFPNNYIPSFAWGGAKGFTTYKLENALETIERVYARRDKKLDKIERELMVAVFDITARFRRWEGKD